MKYVYTKILGVLGFIVGVIILFVTIDNDIWEYDLATWGIMVGGSVIGAVIGAIIDVLIDRNYNNNFYQPYYSNYNAPYSKFSDNTMSHNHNAEAEMFSFFSTYLGYFSSFVIKSSKRQFLLDSEFEYIQGALLQYVDPVQAQTIMNDVQSMLKTALDYDDFLNCALEFELDTPIETRIEMISFLFGLTFSDREMMDAEIRTISQISQEIGVSEYDFEIIKNNFFDFINNQHQDEFSSPSTSIDDNDNDYKTLNVDPSATDHEIKKAFREQVLLYHPDKVNHMGEKIIKAAEEHSIKINEAYERIKKSRGMN